MPISLRYPPGGAWPAEMRSDMAAAFVDAESEADFLKYVGVVYPAPLVRPGRPSVWLRDELTAYTQPLEEVGGVFS